VRHRSDPAHAAAAVCENTAYLNASEPIMPFIPVIAVPPRIRRASAPLVALRRFARWCQLCHERAAQRHHLAELDERMLRDVGLTPAEAARECAKPWWRG
jgi:uncharacterized protein YjiS (DUF1127 family)